jgi:hypothetical protein
MNNSCQEKSRVALPDEGVIVRSFAPEVMRKTLEAARGMAQRDSVANQGTHSRLPQSASLN